MQTNFENKIEEGLYHLQREQKKVQRLLKKQALGVETSDKVFDFADVRTFEGSTYFLALFLLNRMPEQENISPENNT